MAPDKRTRASAAVILALAVPSVGCATGGSAPSAPRPLDDPAGSAAPALFTEITDAVGLAASREPWPEGVFFLPEIMQGGVALLDYDNDGDLDILHARIPPPGTPQAPAPNRLYQQQADGSFRDVSREARIDDPGFGQGIATGDVENDGDVDVYFANYGPDAFYLNNGDGTFTEATAQAGFSGDHWSSAATFCDYDRDGDLDLYVAHYLRYDPATRCQNTMSQRDYCGPQVFHGDPDTLYRNDGGGTFTDVTAAAGVLMPEGGKRAKGLGVVCTDLTGDGWADFYVANDGEANQLWVNRRDGTFFDEAIIRGVAVNQHGQPEASMGLAVGDVNGDLALDLFMTHLANEHNTLYVRGPGPMYLDGTLEAGMAAHDKPFTGFGTGFFDFDHDGDLDIAVVNGRVAHRPALVGANLGEFWNQYAEPNFLFENDGRGVFTNVGLEAGGFTSHVEVARGLAFGDFDRDGDLDLVQSNVDNSLRAYRNDAPPPGSHWLLIRALTGKRDALGSQIAIKTGGRELLGLALAGYSYAGSNDPRAHFGLGAIDRVVEIEVLWPDGRRESFPGGRVDREVTLRQGSGKAR